MAPIILLRPPTPWGCHGRSGRQGIGAPQGARFSGRGGVRVSGTHKSEGLPLALFLTAALISFCFSIALWFFVNKDYGVFVGLWVPSILSLGSLMRARR